MERERGRRREVERMVERLGDEVKRREALEICGRCAGSQAKRVVREEEKVGEKTLRLEAEMVVMKARINELES